ncbi:hypothetical protein [Georgenia sp. Z1491]|uniref:hypothetical protein n=1 Tax=Georgenia sp. Z1491 TaxID=3416707 RepID=UPI003CEE5142
MSTIRRYAASTTAVLLLAGGAVACSSDDEASPQGDGDANIEPPATDGEQDGGAEAPSDDRPPADEDPATVPSDDGSVDDSVVPGDEEPGAEDPGAGEPPVEDPGAEDPAAEDPNASVPPRAEAGFVSFELPENAVEDRQEPGLWQWSLPATPESDPQPAELLVVQGPENHQMTGTFDEEIAAFEQMMVEGLPEDVNWEDGEVDAAEGLRVYRFETLGLEPGEVHWIVENASTGELMQLTVTVNGDSTEMVDAIDATLQPSAS